MHSGPSGLLHLRRYQLKVLNGLLAHWGHGHGRTFTVMFPRQAGKNEVSAALVTSLLHRNAVTGGCVVVCAPSFTPQARISLERTRRALVRSGHVMHAFREQSSGYRLRWGAAEVLFLTARPEAHVAGHTASLALIVDEAQEIDAGWFERQFRPMTASTAAPVVMFGTAWDGTSLLEREAARNREDDAAFGHPRLHHQVPWEEVEKERPAYGNFVREQRERLGANNPLFLSQYELTSSLSKGRLFSPTQLLLLEGPHPRLWAPVQGERYCAGLDFGGEGSQADATVLTIARVDGDRCEVVQHVAWQAAAFSTVEREVAALAGRWRIERLVADATGLGGPLASALGRRLGAMVEPFVFSAGSKAALGHALVAAAETNRLVLYEDDGSEESQTCRRQLRLCAREYLPGGRMTWGNIAGHDDYVTSLALCLAAAQDAGPPRIARGRRGR